MRGDSWNDGALEIRLRRVPACFLGGQVLKQRRTSTPQEEREKEKAEKAEKEAKEAREPQEANDSKNDTDKARAMFLFGRTALTALRNFAGFLAQPCAARLACCSTRGGRRGCGDTERVQEAACMRMLLMLLMLLMLFVNLRGTSSYSAHIFLLISFFLHISGLSPLCRLHGQVFLHSFEGRVFFAAQRYVQFHVLFSFVPDKHDVACSNAAQDGREGPFQLSWRTWTQAPAYARRELRQLSFAGLSMRVLHKLTVHFR